MFWKKAGLICIPLAALAIVSFDQASYAQTGERPRAHSTNLQVAMDSGYLGAGVQDVDPDKAKELNLRDGSGVVVTFLTDGAPGPRAGLRINDVILEFNGQKVANRQEFQDSIMRTAPGTKVTLTVDRQGAKQKIVASLGSRPADLPLTGPPNGVMYPAIPISPLSAEDIQTMMTGDAPRLGFDGLAVGPQLAAYFGVRVGVLVTSVMASTPAGKAGLKAGDVVTKVNGVPVTNPREISGLMRQARKTAVVFTVVREKKEITLRMETAWDRESPDDIFAR